jgi:quercetin dioxygenase-like cupin family protein
MLVKKDRVVIAPDEGAVILGGGVGFVGKLYGEENGGAFAIGEHPLEPGILAAPPHTHTNEDEISYVLEGEIGVMVGEEVYRAPAGSYVLKPPGVIHTFWNPGPESARVVEIFSPAGFERYFEGLAEILSAAGPPDIPRLEALAGRYGMAFHWERMEEIMQRHNLRLQ